MPGEKDLATVFKDYEGVNSLEFHKQGEAGMTSRNQAGERITVYFSDKPVDLE